MVLMRVHDVLSTTAQASRPLGVTNTASAPQKARSVLSSCWFCGATLSFSVAVCGSPVIKCQHLAPFVLNKIALMFFFSAEVLLSCRVQAAHQRFVLCGY